MDQNIDTVLQYSTAVVSAEILRYHGAPNCPVMPTLSYSKMSIGAKRCKSWNGRSQIQQVTEHGEILNFQGAGYFK